MERKKVSKERRMSTARSSGLKTTVDRVVDYLSARRRRVSKTDEMRDMLLFVCSSGPLPRHLFLLHSTPACSVCISICIRAWAALNRVSEIGDGGRKAAGIVISPWQILVAYLQLMAASARCRNEVYARTSEHGRTISHQPLLISSTGTESCSVRSRV